MRTAHPTLADMEALPDGNTCATGHRTQMLVVSLLACLLLACAPPAISDAPEDRLFSKFPIAKLGKKVVLTRGAAKRAAEIGMEPLLTQSVTTTVRGWVLVRLPEESVATIERYADANSKVWERTKKSLRLAACIRGFAKLMQTLQQACFTNFAERGRAQ